MNTLLERLYERFAYDARDARRHAEWLKFVGLSEAQYREIVCEQPKRQTVIEPLTGDVSGLFALRDLIERNYEQAVYGRSPLDRLLDFRVVRNSNIE